MAFTLEQHLQIAALYEKAATDYTVPPQLRKERTNTKLAAKPPMTCLQCPSAKSRGQSAGFNTPSVQVASNLPVASDLTSMYRNCFLPPPTEHSKDCMKAIC